MSVVRPICNLHPKAKVCANNHGGKVYDYLFQEKDSYRRGTNLSG